MKEMIKITASLVIIFVAAGLVMASVFAKTAPIVKIKKEQEETAARKKMMPDADNIIEAGKWEPYGKKENILKVKRRRDNRIPHIHIRQGIFKLYKHTRVCWKGYEG